jgi:hypothetical protein
LIASISVSLTAGSMQDQCPQSFRSVKRPPIQKFIKTRPHRVGLQKFVDSYHLF